MLTFESPIHGDRKKYRTFPRNFFNWTATYRRDSDLFRESIYGYQFQPKQNFMDQPGLGNYYGINITSKTRIAAWFVSNCKTPVRREDYVAELQKHIPVDIFGRCPFNSKPCPRKNQSQCEDMLSQDYLIYLSFENSFYPDYVTEKLLQSVSNGHGTGCIWWANYSNFAPPHSYVNARDFGTPQLLADHLLKLSWNRDLYARYFDWRGEFNLNKKKLEESENGIALGAVV